MNIDLYSLALVSVMAFALLFLRVFPFMVFRGKDTPVLVEYLGKYLPYAIMGMMVVYCLKETKIMGPFHGIAALEEEQLASDSVWNRDLCDTCKLCVCLS